MYAPAVPGCCILDRARTAAGFHPAAAWPEQDCVVPQWCGNQLLCVLCAFAVIISVSSVISVATPEVYDSAQSVDQDSEPVLVHRDFPWGLMLPDWFWWLELSGQSLGAIFGVLHSDVRCDCGTQS